ncbi:MAG: hypothetical protein NC041_06270 [Bacteroides sp.]|nr:hypothetical protein [Prevotella sp.]MCM1406901.1 hypothetical protein [Treponema brennaborense]MCM1470052.1 hypothetical protein [Bacteroides sp.]
MEVFSALKTSFIFSLHHPQPDFYPHRRGSIDAPPDASLRTNAASAHTAA